MKKDFPFVEVPEHLKEIVGDPDPDTRMYRAYGSQEDVAEWFDAVSEICGPEGTVSPGGVSMYAGVSRPGVHKRLKEGRLTTFLYHTIKDGLFFKDRKKLEDGGRPFSLIPVVECKAWYEELRAKRDRKLADKEAAGDGDWEGEFMDKVPKNWRDKVPKK